MYLRSVVGIISILFYGQNCVNCEDEDSFGKVLIGLFLFFLFLLKLKYILELVASGMVEFIHRHFIVVNRSFGGEHG